MIVTGLVWIAAIVGGLILVLLLVPIRMRIGGQMDARQGFGYTLNLDWALGLAGVDKEAGRPWQLHILGLSVLRFSGSKKEKKTREKKKRPWSRAGALKNHLPTVAGIFDRMAGAVFLKGHLAGRIGLSDPADTANFGLFCRMMDLSSRRFRLALDCEYDEEIIYVEAALQATLIFGYLGLVAGMLLLRRQTRMMLRSLRHA